MREIRETEVVTAAQSWRTKRDLADAAKWQLIRAVDQAIASGVSEVRLAEAAGVSRSTIRSWRSPQAPPEPPGHPVPGHGGTTEPLGAPPRYSGTPPASEGS